MKSPIVCLEQYESIIPSERHLDLDYPYNNEWLPGEMVLVWGNLTWRARISRAATHTVSKFFFFTKATECAPRDHPLSCIILLEEQNNGLIFVFHKCDHSYKLWSVYPSKARDKLEIRGSRHLGQTWDPQIWNAYGKSPILRLYNNRHDWRSKDYVYISSLQAMEASWLKTRNNPLDAG